MAGAANPLIQSIMSRLGQIQGGAPAAAPGGPTMSPDQGNPQIGDQLAQQSAELHGADPGMVLQQLNKIKSVMGALFIQTFQRMPNVSGHLSKSMATLDRAIKEAGNAAQTASAVRPPVGLSLATNPPNGPGPQGARPS